MNEFIKVGKVILPKPTGLDYELKPGAVYNLKYDRFGPGVFIEEDGSLNIPKKLYNAEEDTVFMNRVLKYYNQTTKQTTGIMLEGLKGTGKTVMAKVLALNSNLPILVVDPETPADKLNAFFTKFTETEYCIIFDEVEKNWRTTDLLGYLDGVQSTSKKLVLMTCNEINRVSEYLQDRCSRIRYKRTFKTCDNVRFIKQIIEDKGITDTNDELYTFMATRIENLTIDNILSFIEEKQLFTDLDNETIIKDLNIKLTDTPVVSYTEKLPSSKDELSAFEKEEFENACDTNACNECKFRRICEPDNYDKNGNEIKGEKKDLDKEYTETTMSE